MTQDELVLLTAPLDNHVVDVLCCVVGVKEEEQSKVRVDDETRLTGRVVMNVSLGADVLMRLG